MLCLVHYLFVISTSVIDCLGRFVPEMTYYVSSGTLNLTKLNSTIFSVPKKHQNAQISTLNFKKKFTGSP